MRAFRYIALLSGVLVVISWSCSKSRPSDSDTSSSQATPDTKPGVELPDVLISIDWLANHRNDESVVVLDARSTEDYQKGHVDGARSLPYTATYDTRPDNAKNVAPVPAINKLFGDIGVDMSTTVILYGGEDYRAPARVFWVLEAHGHPSVAVLDGGFAGWQAAGKPVSQKKSATWSPKTFVASFQPGRIADKLAVFRAMQDDDITLLDSRSKNEYVGTESKANRKGHIPTAVHADSQQTLSTDEGVCSVAEPNDLDSLYESLDKSKKVYVYCNTGRRASLNYLILRSRGYDVAVYDGSWMEWSSDSQMPVSQGADPGQSPR